MATMPMLTTYADLDKAHAFIRDAEDDDAEVVAVDHPDFYCTRVHGVYRAPLPMLVDRGPLSPEEEAEQLVEALEEGADLSDEDGTDDEYSALADEHYDPSEDDDAPYHAVGMTERDESPVPVLQLRAGRKVAADEVIADEGPSTLSSRRAALLMHGMGQLDRSARRASSWKDTTTAQAQFRRHG